MLIETRLFKISLQFLDFFSEYEKQNSAAKGAGKEQTLQNQ